MEESALHFAQIYQHKLQNTIYKFNSNLPEHLSSCPIDIDVAEFQNTKYLLKPKTLLLRIIADCKKTSRQKFPAAMVEVPMSSNLLLQVALRDGMNLA